ncbi:MAG: L,D-transpeptidase [Alphaproteobacteria bacterium]|nr:L,D-transpeptidase [Alphaproteobacteria bacterium]
MKFFKMLAILAAMAFVGVSAAQAKVNIRIDLSSQRMHVTNSKGESYTWKISSGRTGFSTPRGNYRPYMLKRMHYSKKYYNSPMPYSIFYRGGFAIHGTSAVGMLGRPVSHGCIRLATGNAAKLFAMVQREGASISITGTSPHQMIARGKTNKKIAKSSGKKRSAIAKKTGKKPVNVAGQRRNANPMAFAPARPAAPSLGAWQRNPARR